ncbi:hypothetical protein RM572_08555 [Streptomyces sp. DSM 42041]|uniref:WXG100 family type VII secretion target n=1 Tax=Streptomyces hazeniae TaxID=3075538 RepID=A0ABU2NPC2_9ACTN|nr:hypothetical protein [Streptomyces sp. DSM 42041]MDT0378824.1 hypothetical protein [Streptomyces sp. DSM 42041]
MGNGYKVDLSALDEVIKKLNQVVDGMGSPKTCARYETNIPTGWFGNADFKEAEGLRTTHDGVKSDIEGYIDSLQGLIVKFSSDAAQVRRNYDDQEQRTSDGVKQDTDFS